MVYILELTKQYMKWFHLYGIDVMWLLVNETPDLYTGIYCSKGDLLNLYFDKGVFVLEEFLRKSRSANFIVGLSLSDAKSKIMKSDSHHAKVVVFMLESGDVYFGHTYTPLSYSDISLYNFIRLMSE